MCIFEATASLEGAVVVNTWDWFCCELTATEVGVWALGVGVTTGQEGSIALMRESMSDNILTGNNVFQVLLNLYNFDRVDWSTCTNIEYSIDDLIGPILLVEESH